MSGRRPCTFRQRDVTAAIKAAAAAGVPVRSVKITAEGSIELVIDRPHAQEFGRNEWDDEFDGGDQTKVRQ
jgi:hypothetical protein